MKSSKRKEDSVNRSQLGSIHFTKGTQRRGAPMEFFDPYVYNGISQILITSDQNRYIV